MYIYCLCTWNSIQESAEMKQSCTLPAKLKYDWHFLHLYMVISGNSKSTKKSQISKILSWKYGSTNYPMSLAGSYESKITHRRVRLASSYHSSTPVTAPQLEASGQAHAGPRSRHGESFRPTVGGRGRMCCTHFAEAGGSTAQHTQPCNQHRTSTKAAPHLLPPQFTQSSG